MKIYVRNSPFTNDISDLLETFPSMCGINISTLVPLRAYLGVKGQQ